MKRLLYIACFFCTVLNHAQPKLELEPNGFAPVEVRIPATTNEKLIELSRRWATEFNRREQGADVTDVTENSLTISAFKRNAFYYTNRGMSFEHKIRYNMRLEFRETSYVLRFSIVEIYTEGDVLIESTIRDFFDSEGNLKEDYDELEVSLEDTVNNIAMSHYNFILNFR